MTERERWIVYPLLFLALGSALRDKLIKQTSSERVIAEQLYCENIVCGSIKAERVMQTPLLQADGVAAGEVRARSLRQSGQPVLSISPQYLPQLLQRLGVWRSGPTNGAPAAPAAGAPAPPASVEDPAGSSE